MSTPRAIILASAFTIYAFALLGCAHQPVASGYGIITSHPQATQAGLKILDQGGNAFDAAIAASAVLAVVQPQSASLGAGSLWLIQPANAEWQVLDALPMTPESAEPRYGQSLTQKITLTGARSAGVPGQPAALAYLAETYGHFPLTNLMQDAIRLAYYGTRPDAELTAGLALDPNEFLTQPALARVLARLAKQGRNGFYQGETAALLLDDFKRLGAPWTQSDLDNYQLKLRMPLSWPTENGLAFAPPPPASAGIVQSYIQRLWRSMNIDTRSLEEQIGLIANVFKAGFALQAESLGDPDFNELPLDSWLTPDAIDQKLTLLVNNPASPKIQPKSDSTPSHLASSFIGIFDRYGNKLAATISNHATMGSGLILGGTGLVMNNSLAGFIQDTTTTESGLSFGATNSFYNRVEAGKRSVTMSSPIVVQDGAGTSLIFPLNSDAGPSQLIKATAPQLLPKGLTNFYYHPDNETLTLFSNAPSDLLTTLIQQKPQWTLIEERPLYPASLSLLNASRQIKGFLENRSQGQWISR